MMKKYLLIALLAATCTACDQWLSPKDTTALNEEDTYSSVTTINSVSANLYSRLRYEQDFDYDENAYDLCSWDEATNNCAWWSNIGNRNSYYRQYYDYTLIRDINKHLACLQTKTGSKVDEEHKVYFIAEARYMRAYTYFVLVTRMGGVPLLTEAQEYTTQTLELAKPRNKEAEIYDFILKELTECAEDLSLSPAANVTRATKGAALALKCRVALYAGTLARNYAASQQKGLVLPGQETGIPQDKENGYLQQCIDAYLALEQMGVYSLSSDYGKLFQAGTNAEVIFCKGYDGNNFGNPFTGLNVPRFFRPESKSGAVVNPILNLLDDYEMLDKSIVPFNPYNGMNQAEQLTGVSSSTKDYKIYDNPEDIFAGRDPRLAATIIYPGSSFRGQKMDFCAGLAIKKGNSWTFKSAPTMEDVDNNTDLNYYEGQRLTGKEGPHNGSQSWYVSHSGLLLRKYVDEVSGSEMTKSSQIPYIVFRYGEVLLNAAEAAFYLDEAGVSTYAELSMKATALELINKIRTRAGGETFNLTEAELNLDRIMNERRVELSFEDHRYNDLKRWRIADEVWKYDVENETAMTYGLWPYKIYAPEDETINGKWIYRRVLIEHRGSTSITNDPINFDNTMYYANYPKDDGNPYIVLNPNH